MFLSLVLILDLGKRLISWFLFGFPDGLRVEPINPLSSETMTWLFFPGGPGVHDPCEREPTDVLSDLSAPQADAITHSAQVSEILKLQLCWLFLQSINKRSKTLRSLNHETIKAAAPLLIDYLSNQFIISASHFPASSLYFCVFSCQHRRNALLLMSSFTESPDVNERRAYFTKTLIQNRLINLAHYNQLYKLNSCRFKNKGKGRLVLHLCCF